MTYHPGACVVQQLLSSTIVLGSHTAWARTTSTLMYRMQHGLRLNWLGMRGHCSCGQWAS